MNRSASDTFWRDCFSPLTIPARPAGPERSAEILGELQTLCRNHLSCRYMYPEIEEKSFRFAVEQYLKKLKSARKTTLFEGCSLISIRAEIRNHAYILTLDTAFDPWPRYVKRIGESYANPMWPLGMDKEYDLYALDREGERILAARFGPDSACVTHNVTRYGIPPDTAPAALREAYRRYGLLSLIVKDD